MEGNIGSRAKDEWSSPLDKRAGQDSYKAMRDMITKQGIPKQQEGVRSQEHNIVVSQKIGTGHG